MFVVVEKRPTDSPEAYAHYLKSLEGGKHRVRIGYLNRAIEIDPNFSLATVRRALSLALVLVNQPRWTTDTKSDLAEVERRALEDAGRALALDPGNPVSHHYLGVALWFERKPDEAVIVLREVARLSPSNSNIAYNIGSTKV